MSPGQYFRDAQGVETSSGRVGYVERGSGPVALFVHGVLLNGWFWRHQLESLSDIRRCIAPDLLAHGRTEVGADQEVSVTANARMLGEFLDARKIDRVDLVGNDSGGGICQIFAAVFPERVRSITLTNCDTHDNWPPKAFKPFVELVSRGGLPDLLSAMLRDKSVYRSPQALGLAYERPESVTDETIDAYLKPHVRTQQRTRDLERFVQAFDNEHTVLVEPQLRALNVPALIVWGDDDVYFDVKWSKWLENTLPGPTRRVVLPGARIFFPEERPEQLNRELRSFWT
jgi:pimeloyl-ACP methyl ester carboxylesterase